MDLTPEEMSKSLYVISDKIRALAEMWDGVMKEATYGSAEEAASVAQGEFMESLKNIQKEAYHAGKFLWELHEDQLSAEMDTSEKEYPEE